jgi:hypothetical protein
MKRVVWPIILLTLALTACGKKEQSTTPPNLSAPEKPSASIGYSGAAAHLPAEAEVTASSGPVQLTLRIYKTKRKAKKKAGQSFDPESSLLYQLELKNIGKKRFLVTSIFFSKPWDYGSEVNHGISIAALGPDGKPAFLDGPWDIDPEEVLARANIPEPKKPDPSFWLEPGASVTTIPWVKQRDDELLRGRSKKLPVGQYTELHYLDTMTPGKYRIKAIYNYAYKPEFIKKYKVRVSEDDVEFATPFIEFEVLP